MRIIERGVVHDEGPALIAGNCLCGNGDMLLAFNTNGDTAPGQRTGLVRSRDNGRTWGQPERFFESIFNRGGVEAGCSLTRLVGGRLLLPYADCFYHHPEQHGNEDRSALLFCPISDDHGRTWHNTCAQAYEGLEAFAFGRVVELPGGTLLLPLWGAYDRRGAWAPAVLKSRDGGENWGDWRPIAAHGDETPIILLPDGRLLALLRGHLPGDPTRPFHVCWSEDGGDTWTDPLRISLCGTSPSLHLTPQGTLLAGYRSTLEGGRCHIASSRDGGLTWAFELELELPRGAWEYGGYPVCINLPDGAIFVSFHNHAPAWYEAYNILAEE